MNEPQTTDAGQASVANGEAEPPIFDGDAMVAACKDATATCATELQAFNDKLKTRTDLDKVHQQLVDRGASARAALDAARAELGNAEASLMLAEASAEIDGSAPPVALSEAVEPARKAAAAAAADVARIEAALGILPGRIEQADVELERAAIALKEPLSACFVAVRKAQERLMLDAARPLFAAMVIGYGMAEVGVMNDTVLGSIVIPATDHKSPLLLSGGRVRQPTGDVIMLSEHISDVPVAEALRTFLRPLGQARHAMDREVSRILNARRLAEHRANQARGGKFSLDGPQSYVFEVAAGTRPPAVTGMPEMVYRTPGVRDGG